MKPHRFDPFSFVIGLATAVLAATLLWGDLDVPDLRPSRVWPLPVFALGLMLTLYGLRRLVESARDGARDDPGVPLDADAIEDGSDTEILERD